MDLSSYKQVTWRIHSLTQEVLLQKWNDSRISMSQTLKSTTMIIIGLESHDEADYECLVHYKDINNADKSFITTAMSTLRVVKEAGSSSVNS